MPQLFALLMKLSKKRLSIVPRIFISSPTKKLYRFAIELMDNWSRFEFLITFAVFRMPLFRELKSWAGSTYLKREDRRVEELLLAKGRVIWIFESPPYPLYTVRV